MKASFHTLGCKLNFSETATIQALLEKKGILKTKGREVPDICVVNTCSVTATADKKARQLIRSLASKYPRADIFVTGCYAQLKPEEVAALPNVVAVLGSNEKLKISQFVDNWLQNKETGNPSIFNQPSNAVANPRIVTTPSLEISEFLPSCERGDRTRYFLKVQDGCDYFCTYCTIPFARGRSRSGSVPELVEMARQAALNGGKEIVITGVNIGTFGKDNNQDFLSLLKALDSVEGIERYRISSIEPNLLTDEILNWIASESRAFMPHFHIPLQSGSDKVLKLMNRRYDTSLFSSLIRKIKDLIPEAFIGVDIIAGARGETEPEWNRSYEFASSLDVAKFHVFPYSERQGTKALLLEDSVPQEIRYQRVAKLNKLSESKNTAFILKNIGRESKVLWEKSSSDGLMHGLTENYIRVEAPLIPNLINEISLVSIESIKPGSSEIALASHLPGA